VRDSKHREYITRLEARILMSEELHQHAAEAIRKIEEALRAAEATLNRYSGPLAIHPASDTTTTEKAKRELNAAQRFSVSSAISARVD